MSIYGNALPYFSELLREVDYFEQEPLIGAGYEAPAGTTQIEVIYQNSSEGSSVSGPLGRLSKRSNWTSMSITDELRIWTNSTLKEGAFIHDHGKDRTYRILKRMDWEHQSDFNVYTVEKVVGNMGDEAVLVRKDGVF